MATFGFGPMVEPEVGGDTVDTTHFGLHIQCQWRIIREGAILVGYGDWHWPPRGSDIDSDDFDESNAGRNRRDDLVDDFVAHGQDAHIVERAEGAMSGDLRLDFADGCILEVFPNYATEDDMHDEYWRLLPPGQSSRHFVVTAHGTET